MHCCRGSTGRSHEHGGVVNLKAFFVASLQTALDLSIATPEDILKHVTPDVLSQYLPKPLWARLFTACLGAPKVDAQLVVETIGVPNLCEHVPAQLIWACISDIGNRSLGKAVSEEPIVLRPKSVTTPPPPPSRTTPSSGIPSVTGGSPSQPLTGPPPDVITKPANPTLAPPPKVGPAIPAPTPAGTGSQSLSDIVAELEAEGARDERSSAPSRVRTPTQQRFRQSQTGIGRLAEKATPNPRRPQAAAPAVPGRPARRGETEVEELESETAVASKDGDWRNALAVEDEQLVDWQSSEETLTVAEDEPRKR